MGESRHSLGFFGGLGWAMGQQRIEKSVASMAFLLILDGVEGQEWGGF